MPATCDCAWLLTMPIVATMCGHRSLASLGDWHHDPLGLCAPGEFRVLKVCVVCSCLPFVAWHFCNSDGCEVTCYFDLNHKPDCNLANLKPISLLCRELGCLGVTERELRVGGI